GPAESVDRLLRIADNEQAARPGMHALPERLVGIGRDEQEQDLGLQEVRVLKLVDEVVREALLKLDPNVLPENQISSPHEQVEKVEPAMTAFHLFVRIQRSHELGLKQGGEVGVGASRECLNGLDQFGVGVQDRGPVDGRAVARRSATARRGQRYLVGHGTTGECDDLGRVLVAIQKPGGLRRAEIATQRARGLQVEVEEILGIGGPNAQVRERVEPLQHGLELGIAIERLVSPRRREVTPFGEPPSRDPQTLDRPLSSTLGLPSQASTNSWWWILQYALEPTPEGAREHLFRMPLGEDLKRGVDGGLHGALAKDLRAEPVDGAHPGLLEVRDRMLEPRVFVAPGWRIL